MRLSTITLSTLLASSALASAPGQPGGPAAGMPNMRPHGAAPTGFEENKGQVRTMGGEPAPYVRYRLSQGNTQIFLLGNGIAYQFRRTHLPEGYIEALKDGRMEDLDASRVETGRLDVMLQGAALFPRITAEGRSSDHTNYYADDVLDVHSFSKVTHHDVYPGIDWVVYTTEEGIKQDFVVRPGADPDRIKLLYAHHEELYIDPQGGLVYGNKLGRFTEKAPISFQHGKAVATRYRLHGDVLQFSIDAYDHTQELTIDPDLIWGTYYGGAGFEEGFACATAANGDVALAGWTDSNSGIASGGHQTSHGGGNADAFLALFNSDGVRLWATYYGGGANEVGSGCAFDASGNVYLTGYTESSSGIASAGHQGTYGGGQDAFLVKFSSTGTRLWGTYYGGSGFDSRANCVTDGDGNVYICGWTNSLSGIASGGHQNTIGGLGDAYLVKFDPSGNRSWGTYYGGSGGDGGTACATDESGNVYLTGTTDSGSGIASGGFLNAFAGGDNDLFLAKFSGSGSRQWATYYGGADTENDADVATDPDGNVYLSGTTRSTTGISYNGHQNSFGGTEGGASGYEGDGFLAKFSGSGSRLWATYYGGSADETGDGCAVDAVGNVYLAGSTNSPTAISTPDSHQPTNAGGDAYIVKFDPSGIRQWGTYYGGNFQERIGGCSAGPEGMVNVAGTSGSTSGIAYNGHQNSTTNQAAFLAKFGLFIPPSVHTSTVAGSPFCAGEQLLVPFTVEGNFHSGNTFIAQLSNASGSFSSPVDIGTLSGTAAGNVLAVIPTGTTPGNGYRIRVISSDPDTVGTDNGSDLTINNPSTSCICAVDSEVEPNNSATETNPITAGAAKSGTMGDCATTNNTSDYFSLTTTSQGVLRVEACLSNTGPTALDVTFRVLSSGGATLSTHVLQAGANKQAVAGEFNFPCRGIASYRIAIDNPSTSHCTFYSFTHAILSPSFADDAEPNNSLPGTPVAHDTYTSGRIQFDGDNSQDNFNIAPPANGVMHIEVQAEHAGSATGNFEMILLASNGSTIQTWSIDAGANSTPATTTVSIPCRSGTTNYNVRFASTTCGVSYRWKYTMAAPLYANDVEPNNAVNGSIEDYDTWYEGQVGFDNQTDDDIFTLDPPNNGIMHFAVEAEHIGASPGTVTVALLSAAGAVIQSWDMVAGANGVMEDSLVSVPCRSGVANYNLRFSDVSCGVSYRWKYTMTAPHFADDAEPNNSAPGNTLAHDTFTEGQVEFDGDTYDYYTITPPTNGVMNFEVEAEHVGAATGAMELALLNSAGTVIQTWPLGVGANSVPQASAMSITCRSTVNPYRVRITSSTCGVSYRFKYTMTAPLFAVDAEPNNSQPGAVLAADTYTEGHLAFDAESTYDFYRIEQPANGRVNVELQAEHTGATPGTITVALLSTTGTTVQTWSFPVGANGVPVTTVLNRTCLTAPAFYDLRLSSSVCGASYKLKYTITPAAFSNDVEPNNSTAQAIILPETQTAQGQLNFPGQDNSDRYKVDMSGDGVLNVLLEAEHAGPETNATMTVELYISVGTILQTWTAPIGADAVPISTVLNRLCLGNTLSYYLRVSSSICGTSYRISYTVTPPAFANDVEPNNGAPGTPVAHDTFAEGHLEFYNLSAYDYYNIVPPINGVMRFEVQAEHAGADAGTMELRLINTVGTTIQFWTIPVGANGVPITSTVEITCRGSSTDYDVRLSATTCGVSYRWKYTMIPAMFPTDAEPNNGTPGSGGSPVAHDTYQDGQIGFDAQTGNDLYNIVPPFNGQMTFEIQAEHAGSVAGSMTFALYTSAGTVIQSWTVPAGANGVPLTSTYMVTCRGFTTDYDIGITSVTCGVSYRWKYTMSPPVFANDVEPNSTYGGSTEAHDTWYEGQIAFNTTDADIYNLIPPINGIMNIEVQAEHAGTVQGTVAVTLVNSVGTTIQAWTMPAGANGAPIDTVVSITCRANTTDYDLVFSGITCGVSYRWKYWMTPPVFASDVEPNNSTGSATPINLSNAAQTGQIGFHTQTDDDYYIFSHPGGPWSATVSAEHAGAGVGSMNMLVRTLAGTTVGSFSVPAGGSSNPLTNTFSIASLGAVSYRIVLSDVTCGVSYRIHCYDDDNDGVCNGSDVCPGGPEPGTPCDDGNASTINDVITGSCNCAGTPATVNVPLRVMLEGPYNPDIGLMGDALRSLAAFPLTDPYPGLGYVHAGGGNSGSVPPAVLAISGDDAVVDWVVIELRSAIAPATVVASRSALVQRDGDVVELDGLTPVAFSLSSGMYHVAVRHRNHLGAMTKDPVMVSAGTALLDFTDAAFEAYGAQAMKSIAGAFPAEALWSGDVSFDGELKYVGEFNDRDPILVLIGGSVPTNVVSGVYSTADCNLDGNVMYVGDGNDRDPILVNIGGSVPTNTRQEQLP